MKRLAAVTSLALAGAGTVVACADHSSSGGGEVSTGALSAGQDSGTAQGPSRLDACQGRIPCVRATVLGIVLSSNLQIVDESNNPHPVAEWIFQTAEGADPKAVANAADMISIETSPAGPGRTQVNFVLSTVFRVEGELKDPPKDCLSCNAFDDGVAVAFEFTIEGDHIVESQVPGHVAG
jgi:hypothetical protein